MPRTIEIATEKAVATITLSRQEVHNAFNPDMIAELTGAFQELGANAAIRVIVLTGAGRSFSAGADLNWMRSMASFAEEENIADAQRLDGMF